MTLEPKRPIPQSDRGRTISWAIREIHGFSLFEALLAIALMGLVLAMLGTVTAQWLPSWNFGFARLQRADVVGLAIERVAADLASAEFISLDRTRQGATFEGTTSSIVLVRSALGPNALDGLEIVKIAEQQVGDGFALVRTRAPLALFGPENTGLQSLERDVDAPVIAVADKVTLLRPPYRTSFAFADIKLDWKDSWRGVPVLPRAVRITVEDARKPGVSTSLVVPLHIDGASVCANAGSPSGCMDELARVGAVRVGNEAKEKQR
jgi:general secretion pathway protein J